MFYKCSKYFLSKDFLTAFIIAGLIFCGSNVYAVQSFVALNATPSKPAPMKFSFFINPVSPSNTLSSLSNGGVMVNTVVESVGLRGGLSYFSGKGSPASTLDNFAAIYSFNGWNKFDNILVVPNDSFLLSPLPLFAKDTVGDHLQAVSLYGGYDLTPSLKIKGAFLISKSPTNNALSDSTSLANSSYSWWLDFGGDYKLNEKMTYTVNFGYYDSDELLYDSSGNEMVQGSVYLFNNQLNMSF